MVISSVMIFAVFQTFLCLSPKCPHSFTQSMTCFPFPFPHNPYLIFLPHLLSYLLIRSFWIPRTSQVYLVYSVTRILRSTEGVLPTGKSPACHDFRRFSPLFFLKSQAPTHPTSLNHDMFPHSLSYLISCPISLILSFIFFQSFRLEGKLSHLGLLGLETFGPWEDSTED